MVELPPREIVLAASVASGGVIAGARIRATPDEPLDAGAEGTASGGVTAGSRTRFDLKPLFLPEVELSGRTWSPETWT